MSRPRRIPRRRPARAPSWRRAVLLVLGLLLLLPLVARAEGTSWSVRGLLDVTASGRGQGFTSNTFAQGDNPFDPFGLRVFADARVNPRLAVFTQVVLHDVPGPYVSGAYLSVTPWPGRDLQVIAGKIPWLIGTFPPRAYSDRNPLVGTPLLYQMHTTLTWYALPPNADRLLAAAGSGQGGVGYLGPGAPGMAVVDESYWDSGAMLAGSARPLEFAVGVTTGTPGWGNTAEDENHGKSVLGRLGLAPVPGWRAGVSGAYGPYLIEALGPRLPPGHGPDDYHQLLVMGDLEIERGHLEARAEGYANAWETPNLGDLRVHGGYVEGSFTVLPGWWIAARGEQMRFATLRDSSGVGRPWDNDRDRWEAGLGWRPDRNLRLKAVWQRTTEKRSAPGAADEDHDLIALQLSASF